jgi:hypothetical protein
MHKSTILRKQSTFELFSKILWPRYDKLNRHEYGWL